MSLPDVSRLRTIADETWRALDARLRAIGLDLDFVAKLAPLGAGLLEPMREALHVWRTRASRTPAGDAYRMLMVGDAVAEADARALLGDLSLDAFVAAGFLERSERGVVSPFRTQLLGARYVVGDALSHGGDAVMAAGGTTAVIAHAAASVANAERVLDMGCGSGALALLCAGACERVVGVDINTRAIELARVSAAMAGFANLDWRVGDLFAPVAGESFEVVLAQPPFVARPPGARDATYLWGGERGDELALRLLREAPSALSERGRLVLFANFPVTDDELIERRLRAALGRDDMKLLVIETPEADIDELCARDALVFHPSFDAEYVERVVATREHLARAGVRGIRQAMVILERGDPAWTATFATRPLGRVRVAMPRIDALVASHDLLAQGAAALDRARLRIARGVTFDPPNPPPNGATLIQFPADMPGAGAAIPAHVHDLLVVVNESPNVAAAMNRVSASVAASKRELAIAQQREAIRGALRRGILQLA